MVAIAVQTAVVDVMTSGEFCNMRRRVAHLLTMYPTPAHAATDDKDIRIYEQGPSAAHYANPCLN
jgi:hypothetical protein